MLKMTFTDVLSRCMEDRDYPAFMAIQDAMDEDLKKSEEEMKALRKAQNYYDVDCVKYYELEIEMYKLLIKFNEKLIVMKKFNSAPEIKYRAEPVKEPIKIVG